MSSSCVVSGSHPRFSFSLKNEGPLGLENVCMYMYVTVGFFQKGDLGCGNTLNSVTAFVTVVTWNEKANKMEENHIESRRDK